MALVAALALVVGGTGHAIQKLQAEPRGGQAEAEKPAGPAFPRDRIPPGSALQRAGQQLPGDQTPGAADVTVSIRLQPGVTPEFLQKAIVWLLEAQQRDGGWGAGSHNRQDVLDPHAVPADPATTSFVLMALVRAGHTPVEGEYKAAVRRGTEFLVKRIEDYPSSGPKITDLTSTQPQTKLGPLVDTSMAAQYLAKVLAKLPADDPLHKRVDQALEKCLAKLQASQKPDGSWAEGGWAPVLQSANACNAIELAKAVGKKVDQSVLNRARDYQKGNFDAKTGRADAGKAAGVELYALSGAQRANAGEARAAQEILDQARQEGRVGADAPVSRSSLIQAGVNEKDADRLAKAATDSREQARRLGDEQLLQGFGNNGGEEFYSYLMTSESLVILGGDDWHGWNQKIHDRLAKVQNKDGSWAGHHCITSPTFCTAAVVACLMTDRDAELLRKIAQEHKPPAAKPAR